MQEHKANGDFKAYEPSELHRGEVKALKSFGNTHDQIASYLEISRETLEKYYRYELDNAALIANATVAKRLFAKAVNQDDLSAQVFWLKTRARWRTRDDVVDDEQREKLDSDADANRKRTLEAKHKKDL
jgi:hypothetical protein